MFVKQYVAMTLGLILVTVHIIMSVFLFIIFGDSANIHVEDFALPMSVTYSISIVKWFTENGGTINEKDRVIVGFPYVILVTIIATSLISAYIGGAVAFRFYDWDITSEVLNNFYLSIETTMGGMFGILFTDLYGKQQ